jgi:bifunctional oligoribonuclease and PAP phosphatase NrnA
MEQTPKQQAVSLINRAQRVLVVPGRPDGDSIGAGLGMFLILKKLNKDVHIAVMDPVSASYRFLPAIENIEVELEGARDLVITLANPRTEPDKLSYSFQDGKLSITVTPKVGAYDPADAVFTKGEAKYDLVITLDAPDLSQLGTIAVEHPALFSDTPVLNIDHHASNNYFGAVNLVDLTATSASEVLVGLAEALNVELDSDIATALLTGIVSDTGSFQHSNTTPKSLTVAAQLVAVGAKQQEIIKHLFKTKPFATLKLWGQVLSNLQFEPELKLVWAGVSLADIQATGSDNDGLTGLIDELMTSVPGADIVLLLSEREPRVISGSLRTTRGVNAMEIASLLGGGGHAGAAGFRLPDMDIAEAIALVREKVSGYRAVGQDQPASFSPATEPLEKPAVEA